jgi:hypothetical protein
MLLKHSGDPIDALYELGFVERLRSELGSLIINLECHRCFFI